MIIYANDVFRTPRMGDLVEDHTGLRFRVAGYYAFDGYDIVPIYRGVLFVNVVRYTNNEVNDGYAKGYEPSEIAVKNMQRIDKGVVMCGDDYLYQAHCKRYRRAMQVKSATLPKTKN